MTGIKSWFVEAVLDFEGILKPLNFMTPFYGWVSTASRLEPLLGGSLLFSY